jgi:CrcB protein
MLKLLVIGLGGFLGAILRFGLSSLVQRHTRGVFPAGTLVVNVLGCFCLGALMGLIEERQLFSPSTRLFVAVGLLGSLTTFSTFGFETLELVRTGSTRLAIANVLANVSVGLGAVLLGRAAARLVGS